MAIPFPTLFRRLGALSHRLHQHRLRRRAKFILRSCWYWDCTVGWLDILFEQRWLRALLVIQPALAERLHRPYQQAGFGCRERLAALQEHHLLCAEIGWQRLSGKVARHGLLLAEIVDRDAQPLQLDLTCISQFAKEGEWALSLRRDGERLYTMALSLRQGADGKHLFIGCVQGLSRNDSRELVRELTHALHGERPRSLLLEAARSVATAAGCSRVELVGDQTHIYRNLRKRRQIRFRYDQFASELGGEPSGAGTWWIPVTSVRRPLEQVISKRRAQVARKYRAIDDMRAQVARALS